MNDEYTNSIVENLTPATGTIEIEELLNNIEKFISDRAILPKGASAAITLWCLATYGIDLFRIFPRLTITSPEKRCGKSTVLDLIEAFVHKPLITSNMTLASIYRVIEAHQPTLLIDEADTFVAGGSSEMTGIINSGHAKSRAFVTRCDGDSHEVKKFSTWAPMVLASIGNLPSTIMDRSIVIKLMRKAKTESVLRLPPDLLSKATKQRQQLLKWILDNTKAIKMNLIEPPHLGSDRAVDNWLPLFTIANQVSPAWLDKCKSAYQSLSHYDAEPELSTLLLEEIREIFNTHKGDKIPSADMVNKLIKNKDKPWCEHKNGRAISQSGLAKMLSIYGIKPKAIRYGNKTPRGYELKQFQDSFDRYL